ncbi:MAG: hypothetical protein E7452_10960 [Ruminococcaceae bacterium]|nr:hypothetical protein [Oscillospiraceae bacterium]
MRKLLLMDKYHISLHGGLCAEEGEAVQRTCPPIKPTAPILRPDKPWESRQLNWVSMRVEDGLYRVWYEAFDLDSTHDCECRLCYAESRDGEHWEKPNLGICDYHGSKENNIVIDNNVVGGLGIHGHSIFVDPNAPAEARYRCVFVGIIKHPSGVDGMLDVMSFAYSPDGIRWTHGLPELPNDFLHYPITPFGSDTQCSVFWDPDYKKYVGYFRTWLHTGARSIARSETSDLTSWPTPRTILTPDSTDPHLTDYYNNGATRYTSGGDTAYFLFYSPYDHETQKCWARVAISRDGVIFDRIDRRIFLDNDQPYDAGMIFVASGIHDIGNGECAMLYNAASWDHSTAEVTAADPGGAVMVKFVRDRIVGLETQTFYNFSTAGWVDPQNPEVYVNAIVRGRLRAALIRDDKFVPGYSPDDCEPLTGDLRDAKITWKGSAEETKDAVLKLYLEDGIIFSATVNHL